MRIERGTTISIQNKNLRKSKLGIESELMFGI
jgi:hypothetical protein